MNIQFDENVFKKFRMALIFNALTKQIEKNLFMFSEHYMIHNVI